MSNVETLIRDLREQAIRDNDQALRITCDVALTGRDSYLEQATPECLDEQGHWDYSGAGYSYRELRAIRKAQRMMMREAQLALMLAVMRRAAQ